MIAKKRTIPLELEKLKALIRRLLPNFPKRTAVEEALTRRRAGFKGEQSLDYPLSFLSPQQYLIFHDLRLNDGRHYFQMDTLVLSTRFLLILEVKNISGTITFNCDMNQLVRLLDKKEEAFQDPIIQVDRQQKQLHLWLKRHTSVPIPIVPLVISANERTVIKTTDHSPSFFEKVIPAAALPNCIEKLEQKYKPQKVELKKIVDKLLEKHTELDQNILERFHIMESDLLTGVQCPSCVKYRMERIQKMWRCPHCGHKSRNADHQALKDFSLLISPTISNSEAQQFLHIHSPDVTKRILQKYAIKQYGRTSSRRYRLRP